MYKRQDFGCVSLTAVWEWLQTGPAGVPAVSLTECIVWVAMTMALHGTQVNSNLSRFDSARVDLDKVRVGSSQLGSVRFDLDKFGSGLLSSVRFGSI